jgi:hypothetical protein
MIRHIGLFKIKENALGKSKSENIDQIKHNVENLKANIKTIKMIEVKEKIADPSFLSDDLCVFVEFDTKEDYEFYFNHSIHKEAAHFASSVSESVHGITYEV